MLVQSPLNVPSVRRLVIKESLELRLQSLHLGFQGPYLKLSRQPANKESERGERDLVLLSLLLNMPNMSLAFHQRSGISHGASSGSVRPMKTNPIVGPHGHQIVKHPFFFRGATQRLVREQATSPFDRQQPKLVVVRQGGPLSWIILLQLVQDLSQSS